MQQVQNLIEKKFIELTKEKQEWFIRQWTDLIQNWLNKAKILVNEDTALLNQLSQSSRDVFELDKIDNAIKVRRNTQQLELKRAVLLEGYQILNLIGEQIRGEAIYYSITVTKGGEKLSSNRTKEVYTWKVPLSKLLDVITQSGINLRLKAPSTIYNMMKKEDEGKKWSEEEWSEEKKQNFLILSRQVRNNIHWPQWHKINDGNVLEIFFRFLNDGFTPTYPEIEPKYWEILGDAAKRTMIAPDPFYKGGDLGNIQIKGLNASITNLNTLIINLEKVFQILTNGVFNTEKVVEETLNENYNSFNIQQSISTMQNEITQNLIEYFTSPINRDLTIR